MAEQLYCTKCRKTLKEDQFYQYKDGTKAEICKNCMTMHINNFDPETYVWLLEKFDVPYIPAEWNVLRDRAYAKGPEKMTGLSVFGKYLSKMKLKQWKDYSWKDSAELQEKSKQKEQDNLDRIKANKMTPEQMEQLKKDYADGLVSEAEYLTRMDTYEVDKAREEEAIARMNAGFSSGSSGSSSSAMGYEDIPDVNIGADLTDEDKMYLALKWGRLYHADEWVALEQLYTEFMSSFDIQGAARIDTLKMICKTSLKMNQAIDCGDIDSYQKLSKVYDAMMKAAKFTEAQNKEEKKDAADSIGELVAFCEKEGGFIPRYYITKPTDDVDVVLKDNKEYLSSLVKGDAGLAQQIENYIKKREILEEQKQNRTIAAEKGLEQYEINDEELQEYRDNIEEQIQKDSEVKADES